MKATLSEYRFTTEEEDDDKEPHMQGLCRSNDLCPAEAVLVAVLRH